MDFHVEQAGQGIYGNVAHTAGASVALHPGKSVTIADPVSRCLVRVTSKQADGSLRLQCANVFDQRWQHWISSRQHDLPVRLDQPGSNIRLLPGYALDGAKAFKVGWRNARDHGHMRLHHPRARRDLTRSRHADLEHRVFGICRHARECQRHAPVIVEAFHRPVRLARASMDARNHFLDACLADRTGNRNPHRIYSAFTSGDAELL